MSLNPNEIFKQAMSEFDRELCLHPEALAETCDHIIRAHTISKIVLKTIAENGYVYSSKSESLSDIDFSSDMPKSEDFPPKLVGVNKASIFKGFCGKHDNALFKPIEQGTIGLDAKSIFLLSYRTKAHELYLKMAELKLREFIHYYYSNAFSKKFNVDISDPNLAKIPILTEIAKHIHDSKLHVHEATLSKKRHDTILTNNNFSELKYVAVRLDKQLPIVTSDCMFPGIDFEGNTLLDGRENFEDSPVVLLNLVNDDNGAVASMAWLSGDEHINQLADSFLKMVELRRADFLVQLGITIFENTYYCPSWWEGLDGAIRNTLCEAANIGIYPDAPKLHEVIAQVIDLGLSGAITEKVISNE